MYDFVKHISKLAVSVRTNKYITPMSKTIEIKKTHIRNLLLSFVIGFMILFVLEHFGKFSFFAPSPTTYDNEGRFNMYSSIPYSTKVTSIYYESFFGEKIMTNGNNYTVSDLSFKDSEFNKYSVKSYYYTQATVGDFKYGLYISFGLFLITLFFSIFKIKLT